MSFAATCTHIHNAAYLFLVSSSARVFYSADSATSLALHGCCFFPPLKYVMFNWVRITSFSTAHRTLIQWTPYSMTMPCTMYVRVHSKCEQSVGNCSALCLCARFIFDWREDYVFLWPAVCKNCKVSTAKLLQLHSSSIVIFQNYGFLHVLHVTNAKVCYSFILVTGACERLCCCRWQIMRCRTDGNGAVELSWAKRSIDDWWLRTHTKQAKMIQTFWINLYHWKQKVPN